MSFSLIIQVLILLGVSNGAPVVAKKILGPRYAWPVDFGAKLQDGHAVFGSSKTYRGLIVAVAATSLAAPAIGIDWRYGALTALLAMLGDLASSFIKRRLGHAPSSRAPGLDHIPESLLPALALSAVLDLSAGEVVAIVAGFWLGAVVLSRLAFQIGLRDHPY